MVAARYGAVLLPSLFVSPQLDGLGIGGSGVYAILDRIFGQGVPVRTDGCFQGGPSWLAIVGQTPVGSCWYMTNGIILPDQFRTVAYGAPSEN